MAHLAGRLYLVVRLLVRLRRLNYEMAATTLWAKVSIGRS